MQHSSGLARSLHAVFILAIVASLFFAPSQVPAAQAAGTACVTSGPASGAYSVTPCITAPVDGATITGAQSITASYSTTGANPGVAKLIFYLGGSYLITDYQPAYTFTLPSTKFVDGVYSLEVEALMKDGFTSQRASISVTLSNGVTKPPVNTNTFTPTSGTTPAAGQPFVLATAGDGADGATNAGAVTDLINSWNPNLFLYVGDVYENGTATEFYNWYGAGSTFYGRFRPITDPVVGNHEYTAGVAPGYFDYWNNVPSYYSYDANGWHFIALNSNCGLLNNCQPGQAEYNWLQNDLNTHNNQCTIAYSHHPVYNVGPEGYTTTMNAMWSLMAQHGVDIMLTGHDHDYQRWLPLNGSGQPSSTGITEFVTGTGGHGIQQFITTDNRLAVGYDTSPYSFGALRMELNHDGASFQFVNSQGLVLDSGAIPCSGAPADTTAPTAPSNLTVTSTSGTQAALAWSEATDNTGVLAYDIYRNGTLLTSLGLTTSYTDSNLTAGATYTYQVQARDGAGNTSAPSNSASVTMQSLVFGDGFESGNLSLWTSSVNTLVQTQERYAGTYAARITGTGSTQNYASKTLSATQPDLYYNLRFKLLSLGSTSAYLQRFRTGANGAILGVFVSGSTGKLGVRNDVAATSLTSGPVVTTGAWHELQTHVKINGASSTVEVWFDGAQVAALSSTAQSLGTSPIGRIQLGDSSGTDVYDIALDDVGVNTSFVDDSDSQPPSTPAGLSANASAPNAVSLSWTASSDNVNVTGYDLFRDGALAASLGIVTSYTDTPVSPSFSYQYQVRARDAAGNVSGFSNAASVTTPADVTPPTVTVTAPTDGLTVNGSVRIAADAADNVLVDHVDILLNGTVVASVGEGGPYGYQWDTTTVADGSTQVITARAVDSSGNAATSSSVTVTVNNGGGDTLPPSVPGNFTALAGGASRADLSWSASTDNFGVTGYDVYRNGALLTTVGALITYSDATVTTGASYQYQVGARDAAGNVSALTAPVAVTIPAALFTDGFESGSLSQWTNNGMTVQQQSVFDGAYSARSTANGSAATYAYKALTSAQNDLYYSTWFQIMSQGSTSAYIQRFRTGANGAILGVFVSSTGKLGVRNDVAATTITSTTAVSQNVWHLLQTHVKINGAASTVEVWFDGTQIAALSSTTQSLGTTAIGRVQLGDSQASDVYDAAFDDVAFDTSFIQPAAAVNTTIVSGPTGTVSASSATFSFSASSAGATFECSLDAAAFSACSSPQSLSGLADGSHVFAVRAIDALGNVDPTPASRTWAIDTTAPTMTGSTPANGATDAALTAAATVTFSEAMSAASLNSTTFTLALQADGTLVPATVAYDSTGNTATLQPGAPLAYATTYVVTVKGGIGGAADLVGNPLASDQSWSFTTLAQDVTAPTVTVTAPADGSSVSGAVTLSADAADNVAVDHVDFLVNGSVVGTDASAPYSFAWNASGLPNGPASISANAVDTSGNIGSSTTINVTVANDVTPPSVPTNLSASAPSGSRVDLTWAASSDDVGVTGYDIFRNGTLLTSVAAVTAYSDTTVGPSNTYQYTVQARDAAGNVSGQSAPASATTPDVLFRDRFETGDLSRWATVSGLLVGGQEVFAGDYAARATASGGAATAQAQFGAGQYDLFYDIRVKLLTQDPTNSVYIMRFRKADTQSAVGIFISPTGKLGYRNDIAGVSNTSTASVSLGAWHEVQAHVRIDPNGGPGLVETWLDGNPLQSQAENLSNAPITRIQLGDSTTGRTYDFAYDDVLAAPFYINPGDVTPPSAPSLSANASTATQVDLAWSASTDDTGVTGYNVYRNGSLIAFLGNVTTFSDTGALPATAYQYTVSARDAAENISAPSAAASVTTPADTTPPTVSLTAPANGLFVAGTLTLSATAADNIGVARVDFLLNGTVVGSDATAPYSFNWNSALAADGPYTVAAQAVDMANNTAVSSASITVDNTPPDTAITSQPAALSNSASASFIFTSNEAGVTFGCSLDGAAVSACTSPASYTGLSSAAHTFLVQATDAAGNIDPTPASYTWTVDTIAPTVTSTTPADRSTNVSPATTVVAAFSEPMNPATITASSFTLKPKGGNSSPVAATVTYDVTTNKATLKPNANLATQTTYNVSLSGAKDLAGNPISNTTWSFTTGILDTTPPSVNLTAPSNGAFVRGSVTLSATASDNVAVASVSFLVNGTVVASDTTSPYSVTWNSASLPDGSVSIAARAVDPSNNTTSTASITVTVDNTPPDTTITSGPTGTLTSNSASFSFTSSEAGSTFACSLDAAAFSACASPVSYSNLTNASHTFQVRAIDRAGNADPTPASQAWTVSAPVAPDTSITSGPSGSVSSASASFGFTATLTGSTFQCSLDAAAFTACTSPAGYTGLSNGTHNFQVRAVSSAGVVDGTPASRTWTVDTQAPSVAITSPASGATVTGQVIIAASASDNIGVASVSVYVDGQLLSTDTAAPYNATWNTNKVKSGSHTIYAVAVDAAGNKTQSAAITVIK